MRIASVKKCDPANGPGTRVSVFVTGCRRHCPGCFNESVWDFNAGYEFNSEWLAMIKEELASPYVDGISLLGGEPFEPENAFGCLSLALLAREYGKTVWAYSGFTYEELRDYHSVLDCVDLLLRQVDVLVDGPFVEEEKDISLTFRGSRNQRIIDVQRSLETGDVVLVKEYMK